MTARTGIRKIEAIEGGHIAWLYPGGADLDEVILALAAAQDAEDAVEWTVIYGSPAIGPSPRVPDATHDEAPDQWEDYFRHLPPWVHTIEDDRPTYVAATNGSREPDVGYFRRLPWCTCGEGHDWHYEPSQPGRGASLAVVVGGAW